MRYLICMVACMAILLSCTVAPAPVPSPPPSPSSPQTLPGPVVDNATSTTLEPPEPASPPAEKPTSFVAAKYVNDAYGFSIQYPEKWIPWSPPIKTAVFIASEVILQPERMAVVVDVRPATDYQRAAKDLIIELISWKAEYAAFLAKPAMEKTVKLADGKTTAYETIWAIANYRV